MKWTPGRRRDVEFLIVSLAIQCILEIRPVYADADSIDVYLLLI